MAESAESPIVQTAQGAVRGRKNKSVRGSLYNSFQGIPYAQPPVGALRFQPPAPPQPWTGVRDATEEGASSPSPPVPFLPTKGDKPAWSEDSLFINVYTPVSDSAKNLPVLVWVHGGAFNAGSGNSDMYSPDNLISENVVVVTFNYRLGVLGFLSLATPELPGNFGLKDMVAALQWVQRNISAFGGDPKNVTIFGESAGGAAVQYLVLSKLTTGLIHKAISMSGVALNPWALQKDPRKFAFALGRVMGCETKDDRELLEFFKKAPTKDFLGKEAEVFGALEPENTFNSLCFLPVVEPDLDGAFITKPPEEILRAGDFHDIPYILGANTLEGLILLKPHEPIKPMNTDEELEKIIPLDLRFPDDLQKKREVLKKVRDFYFPNGFDEKRLVDAMSTRFFVLGVNKTAEHISKLNNRKSSTYLYQFSYDGSTSFLKKLLGFGQWKGTCHGDELAYLFYNTVIPVPVAPGTPDFHMVETLTKLWADFAKNGKPTADDALWKPLSKTSFPFLDIDTKLTSQSNLQGGESQFWNDLYKWAKK